MKTSSLRTVKIAKQAKTISSGRPVNVEGVTPSKWSDCVGYELEGVIDLDLIAAIDAGLKSKKLKPSDKLSKNQLDALLTAEKAKAKDDREKGLKVTPDKVKLDDPLKRGR